MDDMNQPPHPTNPTDSQEFHLPENLDLQKLSSCPMAVPYEPPPRCYPHIEKPLKTSLSKKHFSPSTGKTPREEKEAVAELLAILVDSMEELNTKTRELLLRKFFSEIERDERIEKFIVERLRQSEVKAISNLCEKLPASVRCQISTSDEGDSASAEASVSKDGDKKLQCYEEFSEFVEICTMSSTCERGLSEAVEDLSQELERFRIRTLDVVGVGKDDEGKN